MEIDNAIIIYNSKYPRYIVDLEIDIKRYFRVKKVEFINFNECGDNKVLGFNKAIKKSFDNCEINIILDGRAILLKNNFNENFDQLLKKIKTFKEKMFRFF